MGSKWGGVARALGTGIMAVGQINYREKLETERQFNLDRLRKENRKIKQEDLTEQRKYNEGVTTKNQVFQTGLVDKKITASQNLADGKKVTYDPPETIEGETGLFQKSSNGLMTPVGGTRKHGGSEPAKVKLIKFYRENGFSDKESISLANQSPQKSRKDMFAKFLSGTRGQVNPKTGDLLTMDERKQKALDLTNTVFSLGGQAPSVQDLNAVRLEGESFNQFFDRLSGRSR